MDTITQVNINCTRYATVNQVKYGLLMLIKVKNKIAEIDFIGNENYQIKLYVQ
jgi:hypothetical protein